MNYDLLITIFENIGSLGDIRLLLKSQDSLTEAEEEKLGEMLYISLHNSPLYEDCLGHLKFCKKIEEHDDTQLVANG